MALAAVAVAMRVHNAFAYLLHYGFDALFNWKYVELLTEFFVLPDPEYGWSTARPPLFFHLAGGLARIFGPAARDAVPVIRLASSAVGLGAVALCVAWVRAQGGDAKRCVLAGALVAFLPAHVYLSAMLNEEILAASLTTLALFLYLRAGAAAGGPGGAEGAPRLRRALARDVAVGVAAGLAWLTKLTGVLTALSLAAARVLAGARERRARPALAGACAIGLAALATGGWFYVRSYVLYGYFYPSNLAAHRIMWSMPPGERTLLDYVYVPLATFANPRLDDPALLHSVWGGTYATLWFDGQRHFTPSDDAVVDRVGALVACLAVLPSLAFFAGLARGVRRALADARAPDTPMLLLVAATLAGYAAYTWATPWFATVKGSYLLGLALPYAHYTSEVLADWTDAARRPRWLRILLFVWLAALLAAIVAAFTFGTPLWEMRGGDPLPGLPWEGAPPPDHVW